jgi:hypothetical protein
MTKQTIEVTWQVEDGYAGGSAPHHTSLDLDDLDMTAEEFNALSEDEKIEAVNDYVQDDFNQTISWYVDSIDLSADA